MFYLVILITVVCAVQCDDSSYYVIQVQEDEMPSVMRPTSPLKVYWNVPTMQCASKKIPFQDLHEKYGIIQNENDRFRGEKITILYDPGIFPALLKNQSSGELIFRNGGVPQEGDLDRHLVAFQKFMEESVAKDFSGVGIIDFESWRPIFRQNFGVLLPYKDVSYEIEQKKHWWWPKSWVQAEATARFEKAGKEFMLKTLNLAKQLRPNALWGYYAYPYCFNAAGNESCAKNVPQENDRMSWLWSATTALYPSVYSSKDLSTKQMQQLIRGRIKEAQRHNVKNLPILPYFWYKYRNGGFLSQKDLDSALGTIFRSSASGIIIWGSSNDVNTKEKCQNLLNYVNNTLGPSISKYTKRNRVPIQDEYYNAEADDNVITNDSTAATNPNSTESVQDFEFDLDTVENSTEYITLPVQNEIETVTSFTNNYKEFSNESGTLDRRKIEDDPTGSSNSTKFEVKNKEKYLQNVLQRTNNGYVIDENNASLNIDYNYLFNNKLNCTSIDGVDNHDICDTLTDSISNNSVLKLGTNISETHIANNEIRKTDNNNIAFITEIKSQPTDSVIPSTSTSFNTLLDSENNSSTSFSSENEETYDSLIQNEIENVLINEYNSTIKNRKKGYAVKNKLKAIPVTINNENNSQYAPENYKTTMIDDDVLHENKVNTETDKPIFLSTERHSENKNHLRHSKNKKKGRRRHLKHYTTEVTTPQDTLDSNTMEPTHTTEVIPDVLHLNESTKPPKAYELKGPKDVKKGYEDMEPHIDDRTDELDSFKHLDHVKDEVEEATNSDILIDRDFTTTDQVIIYEVVQE